MKRIIATFLTLIALATAPPVAAQSDNTLLFQNRDWYVVHEYYPGLSLQACAAKSDNRRGDTLDITAWQDEEVVMYLILNDLDAWSGSFNDTLVLDIDYDRWELHGAEFDDDFVQFTFQPEEIEKVKAFLDDLMRGRAIALKSPSGNRTLAAWSLMGFTAAFNSWTDCWNRISPQEDTYGGGSGDSYGVSDRYGDL